MVSRPRQTNPDWTWDEQILAFDTYLRFNTQGNASHSAVIKLSNVLRNLEIHDERDRQETFRNANGVARKLADIHTHRPGYKGKATSGSKLDTAIWEKYGLDQALVVELAETIRRTSKLRLLATLDEEEISQEHREGRLVVRLHLTRERNPKLKQKKIIDVVKRNGSLQCESCNIRLNEVYDSEISEVYECHHLVPLHISGERLTSITDVALLCPTCHRVAHRIHPWPTLAELKTHMVQK